MSSDVEVQFSEDKRSRYLHFDTPWVQGSMRLADPLALDLEYIQRMMVWLLLVEPDAVADLHALQLGLGAGSLTKFCSKKLNMLTSCMELSPQVYRACRQWFRLPDNHSKLNVMLTDAAQGIRQAAWHGAVDVLQVDLYDAQAASPVLNTADFYHDCRATLSPTGCMTVNLFGRNLSYQHSLDHMAAAFGWDALWAFSPTREGNTVVLAQRTPQQPSYDTLWQRANVIESRWDLPACKWLRMFKHISSNPALTSLSKSPKKPK